MKNNTRKKVKNNKKTKMRKNIRKNKSQRSRRTRRTKRSQRGGAILTSDEINYLLQQDYLNIDTVERCMSIDSIIEKLANNEGNTKTLSFTNEGVSCEHTPLQKLGKLLKTNTTLQTLDINSRDPSYINSLVEALKQNKTLKTLSIQYTHFDDDNEGAIVLANSLNSTSLINLSLDTNNITDAGTVALAKALETNTTLKSFSIENNKISTTGADALAESLKANKNLEKFEFKYNTQPKDSGATLINALLHNTILKTFVFNNAVIDVKAIANVFGKGGNTTITNLDISSNPKTNVYIGNDIEYIPFDVKALAIALKNNTTLTNLNISNNAIDDAGAQALAGALNNTKLTELYINGNNIANDGAKALADALKTNTTLQIVKLSANKFDDIGIKYLTEAVNVNQQLVQLWINFKNPSPYNLVEAIKGKRKKRGPPQKSIPGPITGPTHPSTPSTPSAPIVTHIHVASDTSVLDSTESVQNPHEYSIASSGIGPNYSDTAPDSSNQNIKNNKPYYEIDF